MQAGDIWHLFRMFFYRKTRLALMDLIHSIATSEWIISMACPAVSHIQKGNNDNIDSEKCSLVELMPAAELAS